MRGIEIHITAGEYDSDTTPRHIDSPLDERGHHNGCGGLNQNLQALEHAARRLKNRSFGHAYDVINAASDDREVAHAERGAQAVGDGIGSIEQHTLATVE